MIVTPFAPIPSPGPRATTPFPPPNTTASQLAASPLVVPRSLIDRNQSWQALGVVIRFGSTVKDFVVEGGRAAGVVLHGGCCNFCSFPEGRVVMVHLWFISLPVAWQVSNRHTCTICICKTMRAQFNARTHTHVQTYTRISPHARTVPSPTLPLDCENLPASALVLAPGHSARPFCETLASPGSRRHTNHACTHVYAQSHAQTHSQHACVQRASQHACKTHSIPLTHTTLSPSTHPPPVQMARSCLLVQWCSPPATLPGPFTTPWQAGGSS